jgi:hypothetical protein
MELPERVVFVVIDPKTKADQEKLVQGVRPFVIIKMLGPRRCRQLDHQRGTVGVETEWY